MPHGVSSLLVPEEFCAFVRRVLAFRAANARGQPSPCAGTHPSELLHRPCQPWAAGCRSARCARRRLRAVPRARLRPAAVVPSARHQHGQGVVRLVASAAATNGLLLDTLPEFSDQYPGVQVHLAEAEGQDQLLAIARGEVDLVVCRRPPVLPEGWEFHPLRDDRYVILCRADHPLAGARSLKWSDIAKANWLVLPAGVAARQRFDDLARNFPLPARTYPVVTRSLNMLWRLTISAPSATPIISWRATGNKSAQAGVGRTPRA
ncbi:hypothetical protein EJI01_26215 [Variovorax sp. MHTC-1]|nr:hypothetical protein EJI01_26215 [Variovorax sp. MHTC-1]